MQDKDTILKALRHQSRFFTPQKTKTGVMEYEQGYSEDGCKLGRNNKKSLLCICLVSSFLLQTLICRHLFFRFTEIRNSLALLYMNLIYPNLNFVSSCIEILQHKVCIISNPLIKTQISI